MPTPCRALLVSAALCAPLAGCATATMEPGRGLRARARASLVEVVDRSNRTQGVAAVLRATQDRVVLAMVPPRSAGGLFLRLGDERAPVRVRPAGPLLILEALRGEHPLAAFHPAPSAAPGERLFVFAAQPAGGIAQGSTPVVQSHREALLLAEAPAREGESASTAGSTEALRGAVVVTPDAGLAGFVVGADGDQPRALPLEALRTNLLDAALATAGSERLNEEDGFLVYGLSLRSPPAPDALPPAPDAWGEADYFLLLEQEGRRVARVEVTPQRGIPGRQLFWVQQHQGLMARLVERDLTLTRGEVEEDLVLPVEVMLPGAGVSALDLPLDLVPASSSVGRAGQLVLDLEEVDPERASGGDQTPLGASEVQLGRIVSDTLDWQAGDASDLLLVDVQQGGPLLCVLLREHPQLDLELQAFAPSGQRLFDARPQDGRRLLVASGQAPPGRMLLRVRQRGGPPGASSYGLFVIPRAEPGDGLVRSLLRLVARQPARSRPGLGTAEFAREVKLGLVSEAGLDEDALAAAFLQAIGDRTAAARHLVLELLQAHLRPPLDALEAARRGGQPAPATEDALGAAVHRARDAALLLAQRTADTRRYLPVLAAAEGVMPQSIDPAAPGYDVALRARLQAEAERILHQAILDAARDLGDPLIRLRALAVASRWQGPRLKDQLRQELRQLLVQDPSPVVTRALERAFPAEQEERQRRVREQLAPERP